MVMVDNTALKQIKNNKLIAYKKHSTFQIKF